MPRKIHVERNLIVHAPAKSIFDQLNEVKSWEKWSPWLKTDNSSKIQYSDPGSGIGAKIEWKSQNKNDGNGSSYIIASVPNDSISFILDFGKKGKSTGGFRLINAKQSTNVIFSISSDLGMNPVSRWIGLLSDRMIGPDLKKGLSNIEKLMSNIHKLNKYEIIETEIPSQILISIRDTASPATLNQKMTSMFEKISRFLKSKNISPIGTPITFFHTFTPANFDIETCLPISSVVSTPKGLNCKETHGQKAIKVQHYGSHKHITLAYDILHSYLKDEKMVQNGSGWEEYITNPYLEADSSKWLTN
ncbi:MAG: SRPBCC family protein, partial [Bacteroidales bacterium]